MTSTAAASPRPNQRSRQQRVQPRYFHHWRFRHPPAGQRRPNWVNNNPPDLGYVHRLIVGTLFRGVRVDIWCRGAAALAASNLTFGARVTFLMIINMNSSGVSASICANLTRKAAVFLLEYPSCDRYPGSYTRWPCILALFSYFPSILNQNLSRRPRRRHDAPENRTATRNTAGVLVAKCRRGIARPYPA
jgi:hypothetical protein